jgi:aerobic C4-dicarboxylate transport protein
MAVSSNKKTKKPFYKGLLFQVITAILLGVFIGHFWPGLGAQMRPLGDGFINLIKMLITPIIFCTVVTGIAGMRSMRHVGRVGAKAIFCFEVTTTLALIIGMLLMEFYHPGTNINIQAHTDVSVVKEKIGAHETFSAVEFFMNLVPQTLVGAFANGDILQVLLIALIFAAALLALGEKARPTFLVIEGFSSVLFKMVDIITLFAPLGAFGAMAFTVGKFGIESLKGLGELILIFYLTCALFIFGVLAPVVKYYCKLSPMKFFRYLGAELFIVLGTSSSESVLPRLMEKMEYMGCSRPIVGMVVPTGYSFNLVGSCIYFTMAALFILYLNHTQITLLQELSLLGILLLTSKGAAGVTGSAFIVLAATLSSMKLMPAADLDISLAFIYGVDRFMSTGRAITNLIGNGITTVVVAKWENALDYDQAKLALEKGYEEK